MKKSAAPSRKFISPVIETAYSLPDKNIEEKQINTTENLKKQRTTSDILNIFQKTDVEQREDDTITTGTVVAIIKNDSKKNTSQIESNKKFYNILWRKKTAKKHKTWQGDGILEIDGHSGILKDSEGAVLSRVGNMKTELIEDGYILSIGDKEIEIQNVVMDVDKISIKRPLSEANKPVAKKTKVNSSSPLILHSNSVVKMKRISNHYSEPLILPQPPSVHQWNFNTNRKSVTEVRVDYYLARVLRQHQRSGVVFLYECILGFKHHDRFGAILADDMGLGKTLQCITLIWTLLKQGPYGGEPIIKKCLIVTPSSLTENWEKEFLSWLGRERIRLFLIDNKNKPKDYSRVRNVPVVIISYEMFVRHFDDLSDNNFDLVICDEGHRLKNDSVRAAVLLNQLNCKRRILLTGTPIQNDLQEFYSLCNFVNPGILGSNSEYRKYYEEPIVTSREPEADENVKELGEIRTNELNQKTSHFILRRTQTILDKYLPTKTECVVFCKISPLQQKLYSATLDFWENRDLSSRELVHLNIITFLKKICNHPSLVRHIDSKNNLEEKFAEILSDYNEVLPQDSGKLNVLLDLVKTVLENKEKIVIVSSYTQTLDLLGDIFRRSGYKFCRLDGSVRSNQRYKIVNNFNSDFSGDLIFLLSSKAGGVGLNLSGASRLVLFDSDWNPATDVQAMARIWREGQKHSVFLYRFLSSGTIEEKIYQRQISKTDLSNVIVDPNNANSIKLSDDELKDLFSPDFECESLTHSLLNCPCLGNGVAVNNTENTQLDLEDRQCQLGLEDEQKNCHNFKMSNLMLWEHYIKPMDTQMLRKLGFNNSEQEISCIFSNDNLMS